MRNSSSKRSNRAQVKSDFGLRQILATICLLAALASMTYRCFFSSTPTITHREEKEEARTVISIKSNWDAEKAICTIPNPGIAFHVPEGWSYLDDEVNKELDEMALRHGGPKTAIGGILATQLEEWMPVLLLRHELGIIARVRVNKHRLSPSSVINFNDFHKLLRALSKKSQDSELPFLDPYMKSINNRLFWVLPTDSHPLREGSSQYLRFEIYLTIHRRQAVWIEQIIPFDKEEGSLGHEVAIEALMSGIKSLPTRMR